MAEKKQQHRRVTTMTTFTYGVLELRIIEAKNLKPSGKRCDSFVRISAGANSFVSEVFKKSVAPTYNWTLSDVRLDRYVAVSAAPPPPPPPPPPSLRA